MNLFCEMGGRVLLQNTWHALVTMHLLATVLYGIVTLRFAFQILHQTVIYLFRKCQQSQAVSRSIFS